MYFNCFYGRIKVLLLLRVTKAADVMTFINVTESEVAVITVGSDRSALQILQVRQRIALNVPGVVHQTATSQSHGVLWPVMMCNESFEAMTVGRWRTERLVVHTQRTVVSGVLHTRCAMFTWFYVVLVWHQPC